jgi:predicted ester cyclase
MTRDEIVAMFDRRLAAYDRHDAVMLAADYAADCVIESPSGGTHRGPGPAEQVLRHVFDALEVKLTRQSVLIDGNSVAEVYGIVGHDTGRFLGLPPTGKAFQVSGVFLYDVEDGRIVRERRIYDFTAILVQTGLLKAKPIG